MEILEIQTSLGKDMHSAFAPNNSASSYSATKPASSPFNTSTSTTNMPPLSGHGVIPSTSSNQAHESNDGCLKAIEPAASAMITEGQRYKEEEVTGEW